MSYKISESIKEENGKVYFLNERLRDIAYDCDGDRADDYDDVKDSQFAVTVYNNVTDTDRWSTYYEQVFKIGDRFFKTYYSKGSTEVQDEYPYEYEGEWVEVTEVVPKEVTVTKYVAKEGR